MDSNRPVLAGFALTDQGQPVIVSGMNITEIARRLKIPTSELREKLPQLGLGYGRNTVKVNDREAQRIVQAWTEMKRRERLGEKRDEQLVRGAAQRAGDKPVAERTMMLPSVMTVRDFAALIDVPIAKVMRELMKNGILASLNERIDFETASIVASDLGVIAQQQIDNGTKPEEDASTARLTEVLSGEQKENRVSRPPIIVVMGHVDHGKTKILDAIRSTHVMESEAGGITQHIGAYQVHRDDKIITFIDTPGHEAFTAMRSRGARVADIAILVIAADDSIQPQTKEAIKIIKDAGLPFIVAINKIDKPEANIEKVKQDLSALNLLPEDWGGKVITVPVSAKEGTGIEDLLDTLLLVAEMEKENIVADENRSAIGTIIESHIDKGEGNVATILIQAGTLKVGDILGMSGGFLGRVRMLKDYKNQQIQSAAPGMPVKILGLK